MWQLLIYILALLIGWLSAIATVKIGDARRASAASGALFSDLRSSAKSETADSKGTDDRQATDVSTDTDDLMIEGSPRIYTIFFYGTLATCDSWLIGVRKLVRREHAKMLATRTARPWLPQELVDIIIEELVAMDATVIQRRVDVRGDGFYWNVEDARVGTPNEREVQRQIDESGVLVNLVKRDSAISVSISQSPKKRSLVILRASSVQPHMANVRPDGNRYICNREIPDSGSLRRQWEFIKRGDEKVAACCWPPREENGNTTGDWAEYHYPPNRQGKRHGLSRWMHCGRLEDVIGSWDAAAAERLVDKLGLEMVAPSVYSRDPMEPSLLSMQGLGVDHVWDDYLSKMIDCDD